MNRFLGWKTILDKPGAWIQYNTVDFGKQALKTVSVKVLSATGGTLQVRLNSAGGPVIAEIKIPKNNNWKIINAPVIKFQAGIQNLFVVLKNGQSIETDWISFK